MQEHFAMMLPDGSVVLTIVNQYYMQPFSPELVSALWRARGGDLVDYSGDHESAARLYALALLSGAGQLHYGITPEGRAVLAALIEEAEKRGVPISEDT